MERVLIVEDNAFFLQFLREALRSRFPKIDFVAASDGEEALEKIKALPPDAIFMDLRLPGENGLELTKKIKAKYPDIIIIVLTNYDLPEYRKAAYENGANHFISKDSFLDIVNSILSNRNIERDNSNPNIP